MNEPRDLVLLSKAGKVLAEATALDEVKDLRDKAAAVRAYVKKARLGQKLVVEAAVIKLRAERRIGEMLQSIDLAHSARGNQYTGPVEPVAGEEAPILLRDLGITKSDSSRSQRIADLPANVFERYIAANTEADREPTVTGLFRLMRQSRPCQADDDSKSTQPDVISGLALFVEAGYRFATIYADPPWPQNTRRNTRGSLSVERIKAEQVADLCQDNAHLHIWADNATFPVALAVIKAWGFAYHSCLVCLKPTMGDGDYWRESHEFLLLGVRGQLPFSDSNQPSWIECEWSEDGNKPDSIRELVEAVSPGPYLLMYGTLQPKGDWSVYPGPVDWSPEP